MHNKHRDRVRPYEEEFRNNYYQKCKSKTITFNKETEGDILAYADSIKFSTTVKDILRTMMNDAISEGTYKPNKGGSSG